MKDMNYWYLQYHEWISKYICWVKNTKQNIAYMLGVVAQTFGSST